MNGFPFLYIGMLKVQNTGTKCTHAIHDENFCILFTGDEIWSANEKLNMLHATLQRMRFLKLNLMLRH